MKLKYKLQIIRMTQLLLSNGAKNVTTKCSTLVLGLTRFSTIMGSTTIVTSMANSPDVFWADVIAARKASLVGFGDKVT